MVTASHRVHYTTAEYIAFEDSTNAKHEYLDGQIYAMAGGTLEHAALASAFAVVIGSQLRGGRCRTFSSDLRVRVPQTKLITYPDGAVICGPIERDPEASSAANNPTLILEVLSPSTADYDRTDKFAHYQKLPALLLYVLVDPGDRTVEVRTRAADGTWSSRVHRVGDIADLAHVGARLDVNELFATAAEPTA